MSHLIVCVNRIGELCLLLFLFSDLTSDQQSPKPILGSAPALGRIAADYAVTIQDEFLAEQLQLRERQEEERKIEADRCVCVWQLRER